MKLIPRQPLAIAVLATVALLASRPVPADDPGTISAIELAGRLKGGAAIRVLDVRTPEEFAEGHVPGAINIPYDQLGPRLAELGGSRDREIVAYCHSGRRSGTALETLKASGFTRLLHLQGDLPGWQEAGQPVQPTK